MQLIENQYYDGTERGRFSLVCTNYPKCMHKISVVEALNLVSQWRVMVKARQLAANG
jgi:hypothetical protein